MNAPLKPNEVKAANTTRDVKIYDLGFEDRAGFEPGAQTIWTYALCVTRREIGNGLGT